MDIQPATQSGIRLAGALSGACITAALVLGPLAFGGGEAWAFSLIAVLAFTALGAAAARGVFERSARPFAVPLLIPLLLGLGLVALQATRWPAGLLSLASPRTVAAYADASGAVGLPLPAGLPASLHAHGTSLALVRYSSYVALFAAACSYVRGAREIAVLGGVILAAGFVAALVGLLQNVSGADRIYWLRRPPHGAFFGPFPGRNQFASYAAVCTFAGIGLLLLKADRWFGEGGTWREWLPAHGPQVALLVFAIGVVGASVPWSLSRGGTLSLLAGFAGVAGAAALTAGRRRYLPLVGTCFGAVLAVVTCAGWGRVLGRLITLREIIADPSATWRWQMWGDALRMGRDYAATGVGAGAFASVYPVFRTIPTSQLVESPHNEYLHVFAETGLPGALLVVAALAFVLVAVVRGLRGAGDAPLAGFMAAGFGGVLAVALHSTVDYPMRSPAIAATVAVLAAMLCRAAVLAHRPTEGSMPSAPRAVVSTREREQHMPPCSPRVIGPGRRTAVRATFLGLAAVAVAWSAAAWWGLGPLRADLAGARLEILARGTPERELAYLAQAAGGGAGQWPDRAGLAARLGDAAADAAGRASGVLTSLRLGDIALREHRAAALSEPLSAAPLVTLATDCLRSGRADLAWSFSERACEVGRGDVSLRAYLAGAFGRYGCPEVAEGYLERASRLALREATPEASALVNAARIQLTKPKAPGTRL